MKRISWFNNAWINKWYNFALYCFPYSSHHTVHPARMDLPADCWASGTRWKLCSPDWRERKPHCCHRNHGTLVFPILIFTFGQMQMQSHQWHCYTKTLELLLWHMNVFPTFPLQTHDHSVCIRPPLLPFNVTSQNATFQLKGSFVSSSEVFVTLLKVSEWYFCLIEGCVFFPVLHQGTSAMAVAV